MLLALCWALCTTFRGSAAEAQDPDCLKFTPGVAVSEEIEGIESRFGLDLTSLEITTDRWQQWVDMPGGDQASVWKWTPHMDFVVRGPLSGRGQVFSHWYEPDGKGWIRSTYRTPVLTGGAFLRCETSRDGMEQFAISQTGVFPFRIGLTQKGEPDVDLFRGRIKVNRFHVGNDLPKFKSDFCYYIDQDWMLPIGYLYSPTVHMATSGEMLSALSDSDLRFVCWFARDDDQLQGLEAHLYRDGQEIVLPEVVAPVLESYDTGSGWEGGEERAYARFQATFCGMVGMAKDPTTIDEPRRYLLAKHPGAYEIRLVLRGQTVRTARFVVGQDGLIMDETSEWKQKLGSPRMLLPVTVSGNADRTWNKEAWKAEAFWGNPLAGFKVP
jgi:hypothetical protein